MTPSHSKSMPSRATNSLAAHSSSHTARRVWLAGLPIAIFILALLLAGCGSDTSTTSTGTTPPTDTPAPPTATTAPATGDAVTIEDFDFSPVSLSVKAGTTVKWTYTSSGGSQHTVSSDTGAFRSGTLSPGATYSFTFKQAGTFKYHCSFHPSMTAEIIVTA